MVTDPDFKMGRGLSDDRYWVRKTKNLRLCEEKIREVCKDKSNLDFLKSRRFTLQ